MDRDVRWSRRAFLKAAGVAGAGFLATGPLVMSRAGALPAPAGTPSLDQADLDAFIRAQMRMARVPALSAAVVRGDEILWSGEYGSAQAGCVQCRALPTTRR